jgi:RND family efflux transporter MFP subunit
VINKKLEVLKVKNSNLSLGLFFVFTLICILNCDKKVETKGDKIENIPVKVITVEKGDIIETLKLTGDIEPWEFVNIMPDISGKVEKIYVEEGDIVKKGQILAELDTRSAKLLLEQAEAGLAVAKSNFNEASKNWERIKTLYEKGTVSPQQYEKAQLAYESTKAQLEHANSALNLANYQLDVSIMRAPFNGIITEKTLNENETINPMMPGSKGVVTLMDLSNVKIHTSISEIKFKNVKLGLIANVAVDAYPDKVFKGKIHKISPTADPLSRTFRIEIVVPNDNMLLRAGMFARIELTIQEQKGVIVIPVESFIKSSENVYVFVIDNNVANKRNVKLGIEDGQKVQVIDGLKEGEKIVTIGKESLNDGSLVQIIGSETE